MLMATWPACVDVTRLPKTGKLKNTEFAVVDGETFDNSPTPDYTLREEQDPRTSTDVSWAREYIATRRG